MNNKDNFTRNDLVQVMNRLGQYWLSSNDIMSPSHDNLIEEELKSLEDISVVEYVAAKNALQRLLIVYRQLR